jgi:hypothetical protein
MATPTDIDRGAPVVAHHEIVVDAPLAEVWARHVDVNEWPSWQPEIPVARLVGPLQPDSTFTWKRGGRAVTSTAYAVDEGVRVLWGDAADGIAAIHAWRFAPVPDGVLVVTEASLAGAPVEADPAAQRSALDASLAAWLIHLKAASEPEE